MTYSLTKARINAILAGPSIAGFITPAKFRKITTPPAFRVFRAYMRPHCPFRHYLHLRHKPYFNKYLDIHRRKKNPALVNPPIDVSRLIFRLKAPSIAPSFQKPAGSPASRPGRFPILVTPASCRQFVIPAKAQPRAGFQNAFSKNSPVPLTLKMQNKAKLKTTEFPVTSFVKGTNKTVFQTPQSKNKAKQTHRNAGILPSVKKNHCVKSCRSHPHKKMTNKPNFKTAIITVSDYSTTGYCSLLTADCSKNKPNQTQWPAGRPRSHQSSLVSRIDMKASWGMLTIPMDFILFLPSFCFFKSFILRVTSPP
jgi:hypothetical protein